AAHYRSDLSPLKAIQYLDIKCFMGELVLTKVDRAGMANSLEVRVPFLHHHLVEKIFSLGERMYHHPQQTKWLLYQQLKNTLPAVILQRKKQGFVGPDSYYMNIDWYRHELKNSCLIQDGLINSEYLDKLLQTKYDWRLWKIMIMEKWYRRWM
ncbi:MAG: asparagine synthase C-terminal domain-containing protein, partial [Chitinophagales bacterium]|nr:asparagine synthase C-terminal domain-containing protein [Chitinophagales bacterium]